MTLPAPVASAGLAALHAAAAAAGLTVSSSASWPSALSISIIECSHVLGSFLAFVSRYLGREIRFFLVRHPCRAVGVFVVPITGAACPQGLRQTARISVYSGLKLLSVRRAIHSQGRKVFHRFPQGHYL